MTDYDKIWCEVDVEQDRDNKTEKLKKVLEALESCEAVNNVTKLQYQPKREEKEQF